MTEQAAIERRHRAGDRSPRGSSPPGERRPAASSSERRPALSGRLMAARPPPGASGLDGDRLVHPGVVPAVADEAALVEHELRARARHAARQPGGPRLALRAYRTYARYLVELMRLPAPEPGPGRGPRRRRTASTARRALLALAKRRSIARRSATSATTRSSRPASRTGAGRSRASPTIRRFPSCSSSSAASARRGASTSSPGATCARSIGVLRRARDARPARRLGLPRRRHPGEAVRRLDHAAGRSGGARGEDRGDDPAGRRSGASRTTTSWSSSRRADHGRRRRARPTSSAATQAIADALERSIAPRPTSGTASSRCGRRPTAEAARRSRPGRRAAMAANLE